MATHSAGLPDEVKGVLRFRLGSDAFLDLTVVDTKKLVCTGSHVDLVGFALGTLLVQELIYRVIEGFRLEQCSHDQEESLPET